MYILRLRFLHLIRQIYVLIKHFVPLTGEVKGNILNLWLYSSNSRSIFHITEVSFTHFWAKRKYKFWLIHSRSQQLTIKTEVFENLHKPFAI